MFPLIDEKSAVCLSTILEQTGSVDISFVSEIQTGKNVDLPTINNFETGRKEILIVTLSAKATNQRTNEADNNNICVFYQEV